MTTSMGKATETTPPDAQQADPPRQDAASAEVNPFQPIQPSGETEAQKTFLTLVPEPYKTKEFVLNAMKTEVPLESLFKQFESAQSLVGQRTGLQVPTAESTPEQIKEWHKAIGVPDDATAYVPKEITWDEADKPFGEHVIKNRVPGVFEALAAKAHALGLTPAQYQDLAETYDKEMVKGIREKLQGEVNKQIENDKTFTQEIQAKYGDKMPQVLETGRNYLASILPKASIDKMVSLPPDALALVTEIGFLTSQKYVREDKPFGNVAPTGSQPNTFKTAAEVSKAAKVLMLDPNWRDKRTNPAKHAEIVKQVDALYAANEKLINSST